MMAGTPHDPNQLITPAKEIEACAAAWLERSVCEGWSDEDQSQLDLWLASSLAHRIAFVRLRVAWSQTDRLAVLQPQNAPPSGRVRIPQVISFSHMTRWAALAVATAAAIGVMFVNWDMPQRVHVYATAVGGHEIVRLGDGSTVELNTDTSLRVAVNLDRRIVWLDKGEAYFQINHDPVRPFIVMAGNRRVTDLGTKFVVRREPNRLQVAVMEGRVWLDATAGKSQSALVSADQSAIATADTISVIRKPEAKLADRLGWRHGVLVFDNTTLADAVREFNRYNKRKLVVSDSVAAAQTIGGTFPKNDVNAFTRVTQEILGLRISDRGDEIFISRR